MLPVHLALCVNRSDMFKKSREKWSVIRAKGKRLYILREGIINTNLFLLLFFVLPDMIFKDGAILAKVIIAL